MTSAWRWLPFSWIKLSCVVKKMPGSLKAKLRGNCSEAGTGEHDRVQQVLASDMSEEVVSSELLTEKQNAIARALVLRTPIKKIAADLDIAPSTVNDHIKALKRKLGAQTTPDLIANLLGQAPPLAPSNWGETKNRLPEGWPGSDSSGRDHEGSLMLSDSVSLPIGGPWKPWSEPQVIPEELDGPESLVPRLLAIGKIIALILAAVILAVLAMQALTGILEQGRVSSG